MTGARGHDSSDRTDANELFQMQMLADIINMIIPLAI